MLASRTPFILIAAAMLWPRPAGADVPPPPGSIEREMAETIRNAGYDCDAVTSFSVATDRESDELVWGGRPRVATCANGKRFLVATPPRRPLQPPPPPPAVRVKPL